MEFIELEHIFWRYLRAFEADPSNLDLAYKTKHALLVSCYCRQKRTSNPALFRVLMFLKYKPKKCYDYFPDPHREKLKEIDVTLGNISVGYIRAKGIYDLKTGIARFSKALKQGVRSNRGRTEKS